MATLTKLAATAATSVMCLSTALLAAPATAGPASTGDPVAGAAASQAVKKRASCDGFRATIVGNRKKNRLVGTRGRDVIVAKGGADMVVGRGGRDIICGGRGGDLLTGMKGRDRLYGGPQKDQCFGERREHRRHFSCEVHGDPFGRPVANPPEPTRATAALSRPAVARAGEFGTEEPFCTPGNASLNRFYFQPAYTNPGYIAIRPVYASWLAQGGWGNDNYPANWLTVSAPLDGQWYAIDMGDYSVRGYTIWGYEVYWWNGSQWVDGRTVPARSYANDFSNAFLQLDYCIT